LSHDAGGEKANRPTSRSYSLGIVAVVVVAFLILLNASAISSELRFFLSNSVTNADGSAPVLQDSGRDPRIDAAFRTAASLLPTTATCVISTDSWHEDYFRASYIMMPRRIWPYRISFSAAPPSALDIAAALVEHNATCALLSADVRPPQDLYRLTHGAYSLYVVRPAGN
jgi:hypothetical protein